MFGHWVGIALKTFCESNCLASFVMVIGLPGRWLTPLSPIGKGADGSRYGNVHSSLLSVALLNQTVGDEASGPVTISYIFVAVSAVQKCTNKNMDTKRLIFASEITTIITLRHSKHSSFSGVRYTESHWSIT